jgi:hypothetical protein
MLYAGGSASILAMVTPSSSAMSLFVFANQLQILLSMVTSEYTLLMSSYGIYLTLEASQVLITQGFVLGDLIFSIRNGCSLFKVLKTVLKASQIVNTSLANRSKISND